MFNIPCMLMRGGTSKGAFFLAKDLPQDIAQRDQLLLAIMGSPDSRQIDGIGGADPLTSKVAIVSRSTRNDADVDYLFLQVFVDQAIVTDAQNCGNILAGVAPFAIERGLVSANSSHTNVRIFMKNTGQIATALVQTPNGKVNYSGETYLDGVPNPAAPISIFFADTAGSKCGALLPTGNVIDEINGVEVTCIDNGMPVVVLNAEDFAINGQESRTELDNNKELKLRLEQIRLQAGKIMNLGDVKEKSIPKMTLISRPLHQGVINTRSFIPHRCHASIGVFGAVSLATASILKGTVANKLVENMPLGTQRQLLIEHPSGATRVALVVDEKQNTVLSSGIVLTARKLFDGEVFANI
ncbi:4-oxalomesaconate tautomerase [Lonepinella sp. BR2474]|uniref:4-oxalomesaconate tautomerase n=1 Tax=Lonepinella sp. BR2474 TaxID=3434548 RepID=UPI003F6E2AFC